MHIVEYVFIEYGEARYVCRVAMAIEDYIAMHIIDIDLFENTMPMKLFPSKI